VNHPTSITSTLARADPDGMIRLVVSARNPGVANWIETTGRRRGILQFRWQRTDRALGPDDGPRAEVVSFDQVAASLPFYADNRIDEAGWRERIASRQRAFAERMLG
ncbi:MAG: hypothetical protein HOQ24_15665, partial [Mycobacteriaceae bacterium]|nr:hypothetical protein [Mycobacteriaceae bacterium]